MKYKSNQRDGLLLKLFMWVGLNYFVGDFSPSTNVYLVPIGTDWLSKVTTDTFFTDLDGRKIINV